MSAVLNERPEGFQRVARALAERGHPHAPLWLEVSARTSQEAADALGVQVGQIAKSVIFRRKADEAAVLVVTSGDRRVDEKKVAAIVSDLSQQFTLEPGDLIFTGTPGKTRAMKPGDVIEVELDGRRILDDVSLSLGAGESAAIMGPSGSGKSTLLYLLGALDRPSSGTVKVDGEDPFTLDDAGLASFRNRRIGFVFQDHALLPQCSVLENVLIPTLVGERDPGAADRAASGPGTRR